MGQGRTVTRAAVYSRLTVNGSADAYLWVDEMSDRLASSARSWVVDGTLSG